MLPLLTPVFCVYATADDGQFKFSSGFDYSSGDYNDAEKTTMLYIPFRTSYKKGPFTGQLSVSWIGIDGPGTVVGGGDGGVVLPPGGATSSKESGVGDTWLSLAYEVDAFPYTYGYIDVIGKIKLPTADEDKRLGTGEVDYTLQLDYMVAWNRLTPMATFAYKIKGDPEGVDLKDVIYLSFGADWRQTDRIHFGATLDYQQASFSGAEDPLEFFTYLNSKVNNMWSLTPYLYVGLSKGSPDIGGGLQLTYKP